MKRFDYIIAGGGSAGLTLAYLLLAVENSKKSILIIDKDPKNQNDRTWCFWQKEPNLLENLIYKSWNEIAVKGAAYSANLNIKPYSYKMIRGIDFYSFMKSELSQFTNLTWKKEEIKAINPSGEVETETENYTAELVFDSTKTLNQFNIPSRYTQLLQHFKGYVIETPKPVFNPEICTYMDFRIPQNGDCRFGYVLPFTANKALVEYTVFSENLLSENEYESGVRNYIGNQLSIHDYKILEEEFGIIPMTDFPFPAQKGNVVNVGISGGFAKPSTGYAFLRTQKILQQMAKNIVSQLPPCENLPFQKPRFKTYDSTLLKVLNSSEYPAHQVFTKLFEKNGAQTILKFLDEETSLSEELKIMSSTPMLTFGKAFIKSLGK